MANIELINAQIEEIDGQYNTFINKLTEHIESVNQNIVRITAAYQSRKDRLLEEKSNLAEK